jgi:two-component system response regulator DegU
MEDTVKIVITDDKKSFRNAIKKLLEPYPVSVIGEAENGRDLLLLLKKVQPDIVLLDLEMPVMDGNQTFELLAKTRPEIKVIILSYYFEGVLMDDYLERGAKGYIPKDGMEPLVLLEALTRVKNGGTFVYEKPGDKNKFSRRQKEILPLIFEGLTNDEIAGEICITRRAVEKQRHKIYKKSGTAKLIDFYKYAFTKGLQFLGKNNKNKREAFKMLTEKV